MRAGQLVRLRDITKRLGVVLAYRSPGDRAWTKYSNKHNLNLGNASVLVGSCPLSPSMVNYSAYLQSNLGTAVGTRVFSIPTKDLDAIEPPDALSSSGEQASREYRDIQEIMSHLDIYAYANIQMGNKIIVGGTLLTIRNMIWPIWELSHNNQSYSLLLPNDNISFRDRASGFIFEPPYAQSRGRERIEPGEFYIVCLDGTGNRQWNTKNVAGTEMVQLHDGDILEGTTTSDVVRLRSHPQQPLIYLSDCPTRKFKHLFFAQGSKVVVSGDNIHYRKRPLAGLKGVVLQSTGPDGDVGVEFETDLDAGTLDGAGKEGYCLLIPATHLKTR